MKKTLFIILLFANVFFANASIRISNYRWRNDNGNETTASWKTTANTAIEISNFNPIRLRIGIEEYSNTGQSVLVSVNAEIEYSENGGPWLNITAPGSKFVFTASGHVPDDTPTTQQITSGNFAGGKFKSTGNNTTFNMLTARVCEHEFSIRPLETIAVSSTYKFRLANYASSAIEPTLTTAAVMCLSPMVFNVTGGGNACESSGVEVGLDNSQTNANYQLKREGIAVGNVVSGTGSALSFGFQTISGNYTIEATSTMPSCTLTTAAMNGSAIADIDPFSVGGDVTGGNVICTNTEGGLLTLTGNVGDIISWESSVSPFTVWTTIPNITTDYSSGILTETTKFRAVSQSGSCNPATSTETTVTVTSVTAAPVGASPQIYVGTVVLSDLTVNGADIKWYDAATNGTELPNNTEVVDGETYYTSQTENGCESNRLAIAVQKISEASQSFCNGATVNDLVTTPTPGQIALWFSDPSGLYPIPQDTLLESGTYYVAQSIPSVVSTVAGSGISGTANGTGTAAQFNKPRGVVADSQGNIFVTDYSNSRIRKITPAGVVTTFAGGTGLYADGTGTATGFNQAHGIAIDASDNLYIGDTGNSRIRKITPAAAVTTIAGQSLQGNTNGNGSAAQFSNPSGITVDLAGTIYVADVTNYRIRKITTTGDVTTLAGSTNGFNNAQGTAAQFSFAYDVAADSAGNIYVADTNNHLIRKITPAGEVTTFAGSTLGYADGVGTAAMFYSPRGVTIDTSDNIYVMDSNNHRIRKITPSGVVTTVAGSGTSGTADGNGNIAEFGTSFGLTVDDAGVIYVADTNNNKIRKIVQGSPISNLEPVTIVINEIPVPEVPVNTVACTSYVLPILASGNYFTEPNGGGTALSAGDSITTSQTLYVFAESGTVPNCTAQNSFDVFIFNPVADAPANVTACDSYVLPALTSGNYFTETNGGGTPLSAGDIITTSQTIYVYTESGTGEPRLSTGDVITTSQTIDVYAQPGIVPNCTAENSFEVLVTPSTSNVTNATVCDTNYFWSEDEQFYYASGIYTSVSECHTEILNLTLNPLLDATITQLGDTITVAETGASYQWNVCENNGTFTPIAGATNQHFLATTAGSYTVEVTKNGCTVMSDCHEIIALGNADFDYNSKLKVYPNPSTDVFYIDTNSRATIVVSDLVGKIIRTMDINSGTSTLDLSNFPSGMYLLKITNENQQVKTMKLIKE